MMIRYLLVLLSHALLLSVITLMLLVSNTLWPEPLAIDELEEKGGFCGTVVGLEDLRVDVQLGKALFKANCAQCHNKNMRDVLTGPALAGVTDRWKDYPREDLYRWIRNSGELIKEGHERALALWLEWDRSVMSPTPNLTDEDIEALLAYIEIH